MFVNKKKIKSHLNNKILIIRDRYDSENRKFHDLKKWVF